MSGVNEEEWKKCIGVEMAFDQLIADLKSDFGLTKTQISNKLIEKGIELKPETPKFVKITPKMIKAAIKQYLESQELQG